MFGVHVFWRFLAGNQISRVEGLCGLTQLQELYIENQKLPIGDELTFEPESLEAVAVRYFTYLLCFAQF